MKTVHIVIISLSLAVLGLGIALFFTNESKNQYKADLTYLKNTVDITVRKKVNDAKQTAIDSTMAAMLKRPMPKKPDTVFINVIKYEKSKNAILDSSSIYQYTWSNRKLDSIYSE